MLLRRLFLPVTGVLTTFALLGLAFAGAASAQGNQGDFGAYIYEGTCDQPSANALDDVGDLDPDESVWMVVGNGEPTPETVFGEDEGISAAVQDLTGSDHVLIVRASDDQSAPVIACGAITGEVDSNGELLVQLDEVEGSGFQGRAHFGPNKDDDDEPTEVTVAIWASSGTPASTPAS